jgi:hypothetical protein
MEPSALARRLGARLASRDVPQVDRLARRLLGLTDPAAETLTNRIRRQFIVPPPR